MYSITDTDTQKLKKCIKIVWLFNIINTETN